MHLSTSLTPQPKPAKAPSRKGVPRSNSATDPTPAYPSRDTRHIRVPHNSFIIARSNVESLAQLHGYFYVYCAKPLFVSGSLLAIRFLNIKIDVNLKNLFGINIFLKFLYAGQIITKWYSSSTQPKSQLLQILGSLGIPFCLPSSIIKLWFDILNFANSLIKKKTVYSC